MKNAKKNYWKPFKIMFGLILFAIGLFAFSEIFDSATLGAVTAVMPALVWIKEGKFTGELTEFELKKLNEEDLIIYMKELNESKVMQVQKGVEDKLKDLISKKDFNELKSKIDEINKKNAENLELRIKEFEDLAERISTRVTESNLDELKGLSTFEISLKTAKVGNENLENVLKTFNKGDKISFQIKATFGGSDISPLTGHVGGQIMGGIGQIATAKLVLSNFFKVSPIQIDGNGTVVYEDWDEATTTRAAEAIAEGAKFPESTAKFKSYSLTIEKIGDSISMTYESMRDFKRFTAELARFITRNIAIKVNNALWNGSGVTPNIAGIYTRTTAFDAVGYTGATTTTPDLLDLIKVLAKQIMNGKDEKYDVNFAFVSWEDYLKLSLAKDSTGRLIYPNGIPTILGVQLVPTSFVADNTLVIGDKNYVELIGDPNAITIETGFKPNDWEDDKESIKGRVRTALLIRNADLDGFLKVTSITEALTAITTV